MLPVKIVLTRIFIVLFFIGFFFFGFCKSSYAATGSFTSPGAPWSAIVGSTFSFSARIDNSDPTTYYTTAYEINSDGMLHECGPFGMGTGGTLSTSCSFPADDIGTYKIDIYEVNIDFTINSLASRNLTVIPVPDLSCSMSLKDFKETANYTTNGAWWGASRFKTRVTCSPILPGGFCTAWEVDGDCTGGETLGENSGYGVGPITNTNNQSGSGWNEIEWTVPGSGSSYCIKAWVRPKVGGSCVSAKAVFPSITFSLWDGRFQIQSISWRPKNLYPNILVYTVEVVGGAKSGEKAELYDSTVGAFCTDQTLVDGGSHQYFICEKNMAGISDWTHYISGDACVSIAQNQRYNDYCFPITAPPPTPTPTIGCTAAYRNYNPASQTVVRGNNYSLQGEITSTTGGTGSYVYMWTRRFGGSDYDMTQTVNPSSLNVWYPAVMRTANFTPGTYYLVILATNENDPAGWNASRECLPAAPMTVVSPTSTPSPSPSPTPMPVSFFQAKGGDVVSNGDIISEIPDSAVDKTFQVDLDGYPGVISYDSNSSANFLPANIISSKSWLAQDTLTYTAYSYDYFYRKLQPVTTLDCTNFQVPASDGSYLANNLVAGECVVNQPLAFGTKKVVIFIDGNLVINDPARITVSNGGFVAFIVKGDINISGEVGDKIVSTANPHLQGVYITDGTIDTYYDKTGNGTGNRLVAAGIFYANTGFSLKRDLLNNAVPPATVSNGLYPSEVFIFRPDLLINAPASMLLSGTSWQEVAP